MSGYTIAPIGLGTTIAGVKVAQGKGILGRILDLLLPLTGLILATLLVVAIGLIVTGAVMRRRGDAADTTAA